MDTISSELEALHDLGFHGKELSPAAHDNIIRHDGFGEVNKKAIMSGFGNHQLVVEAL